MTRIASTLLDGDLTALLQRTQRHRPASDLAGRMLPLVREYGTAAEIADALGPDVTTAMVRRWADRDGLPAYHEPGRGRGTVRYLLDRAAAIERERRARAAWPTEIT